MWINFFLFLFLFFLAEILYFRVAEKYNIVDKPNHRSSHDVVTIRGGGVIFPLAFLVPFAFALFEGWVFISIGLAMISIISLLDDMMNLDSRLRLFVHALAVILLFTNLPGALGLVWLIPMFIVITGIINAYNFMDGINGITALYSIVTIGTLYWVSEKLFPFMAPVFFVSLLASLVVFSFFNLRKRARCFAGDVGSVSLAFIICFLVLSLFIRTDFFLWILLLGIYGLDTVFTIICRILRKEPILKAHRSHFYQYLVNEYGMDAIKVSIIYAMAQLLLNIAVIISYEKNNIWIGFITLLCFMSLYTIFRLRLEGKYRLFNTY